MRFLFFMLTIIIHGLHAQPGKDANNRALKLMEREKYAEALPLLDKIVEANPEITPYRYNRAVTLLNLEEYEKALIDYQYLSRDIPDEAEYYFQIGNIYELTDSLDKVEHYYSKALSLEKENHLLYFKRGTFYLKMNRFAEALPDLNQALVLNPQHINSLHNRGIVYYKLNEKEKACSDWCRSSAGGNLASDAYVEKYCLAYNLDCSRKN